MKKLVFLLGAAFLLAGLPTASVADGGRDGGALVQARKRRAKKRPAKKPPRPAKPPGSRELKTPI